VRISVSAATVEFQPVVGGARLVLTEPDVSLDCGDRPTVREGGAAPALDALNVALRKGRGAPVDGGNVTGSMGHRSPALREAAVCRRAMD
jgi:hypothetical protein